VEKSKFTIIHHIEGLIIAVRKVQNKGRIQIPKEIRRQLNLEDGDLVYWVKSMDGKFYIVKAAQLYG